MHLTSMTLMRCFTRVRELIPFNPAAMSAHSRAEEDKYESYNYYLKLRNEYVSIAA